MRPLFRLFAADYDVVVAGAGPTGLVLSNLLGSYDISVLLLEKRQALPCHPQAHFINQRSMEIFRPLDGLAQEITERTPPLDQWRKFIYTETLQGGSFGEVDHFCGQPSRYTDLSPEPVAHLSQNKLLPLLLDRAQRCPNVDVQFSSHVHSCLSTREGATATYATDNDHRHRNVTSKFVVLADGANSHLVRQQGLTHRGTGPIQNLLSVHFHSEALAKSLAENPAMLYFVFNVHVVMVLVVHCLDDGEFVAQIPFFPPIQRSSDFDHEHCADLIRHAAGFPLNDVRIESVRPWIMKANTLDAFQRGHIFIAGDAAHVFPPAGGFGMNTGIQDAHNLAWKLAATIKNVAPSAHLLSSYTYERRPVVMRNAELSVENWKEAASIPAALGLDPQHASLFSNVIAQSFGSFAPRSLTKSILESGLSLGRRLSGYHGPLAPWRRQKVQEMFASGRLLRLQFPKEDLGFVYASPPEAGDNVDDQSRRRHGRSTPFVPRIVVGGRLPHTWLRLCPSGRVVSSLDIISWSIIKCLVLLIGFERETCVALLSALAKTEAASLAHALLLLPTEGKSDDRVVPEAHDVPFSRLVDVTEMKDSTVLGAIRLFEGEDLGRVLIPGNSGPKTCAVVVRPDGHVACVVERCTSITLSSAISAVFRWHHTKTDY